MVTVAQVMVAEKQSPPSRRRGLKIIHNHIVFTIHFVASFAEAWIENFIIVMRYLFILVASFAEAWIEKTNIIKICKFPEVASFAEAWIENSHG